jgi:NTP pyrophosphatase (non-canonical NTP hydrolase)
MLNKLRDNIHNANKAKGFWDKPRNVGELLMLVTSELSEAMEADRGRGNQLNIEAFNNVLKLYLEDDEVFKVTFEKYIKDTYNDEIADAIIRLFDLAGGHNIDLDFHINAKLKYNSMRERLHGKKY